MRRDVEESLAHVATGEPLLPRLLRRVLQRQHPASHELSLMGRFRCCGNVGLAQAGQIRHVVDHERVRFGRGEQPILKVGRQHRLFPIELAQPRLVRVGEQGARAHEVEVIALDQLTIFGRQRRVRFAARRSHERDETARRRGRSRRCARRASARAPTCALCNVSFVLAPSDCGEGAQHAGEQNTRSLQCDERVLEGRLRRLMRDRRHFGEVLPHALFDRRLVVGVADLIERRSAERKIARREERIVGGSCWRQSGRHGTVQIGSSPSTAGILPNVSRLEWAETQIPREPQRSREREEYKGKANRQHDRHDLDFGPWWRRPRHDDPEERNTDRDELATDQVEHVRADPEVRRFTALERESARGTLVLHLEPAAKDSPTAAARASQPQRASELCRDRGRRGRVRRCAPSVGH